jgi:hypothetical protein
MSDEIEYAMECKPSRNEPKGRSKTDRSQGSKANKERDFRNKPEAASSHYRKQDIERADDRQHDRIEGPVTVVANCMCKHPDRRGDSRTHAQRDYDCAIVH